MNDLEVLRALRGPDPQPDPAVEALTRAALLKRTAPRPAESRRPSSWRFAVPALAMMLVVTGAIMAENILHIGREPVVRPASAAEALERAAEAVTRAPDTSPRPDQWLYLATRTTKGEDIKSRPDIVVGFGPPYRIREGEEWHRLDGMISHFGALGANREHTSSLFVGEGSPKRYSYAELAALPPEPDAVLGWLRQQVAKNSGDSGDPGGDHLFWLIGDILRKNLMPAPVKAAFYRAMAKLPEIVLVPDLTLDDRPVIGIAQNYGWQRQELLLDPETYDLRGTRMIAVADHSGTGENGNWIIPRGTLQEQEVIISRAIVDEPFKTE